MTCNVMTTIKFNGDDLDIETGINIVCFLHQQNITDGQFIVVINKEMVPKSQYGNVVLAKGDALDIISPITGG
ncbi:MAG: sulfur carrier protein ThiS [Piscirickettsiaceae bacterium]|nr:sulfur carrier protein ThiS [Piscirickettsiaceae bacterium]